MAKKKPATVRRELRDAMLASLAVRGLNDKVYTDKVEEYLDFWDHRQQLLADIAERGVVVMDEKRGMLVENRSVSLSAQVSRQMLAIFKSLGFEDLANSSKGGDDFGDYDL